MRLRLNARDRLSKKKCENPAILFDQFIKAIATAPDNFTGLLRQACLVEITDGEIQNGGLWQYFGNNDHYLDHMEVAQAFEDLGAHAHSVLFLAATDVFNAYKVMEAGKKGDYAKQIKILNEKMKDLDHEYLNLLNITDLLETILKQKEKELIEWVD